MKVTVSVFGRFHAFYLAHQLQKRGFLEQLITTYPKFETAKYGIPYSKIESLFSHELTSRAWNRIPPGVKPDVNLQYWFHDRFDQAASQRISDGIDLYVGWSSFSERGLRRAQSMGAKTILERGSAHIECQRDILQEEYERFDVRSQLPHPQIVAKEKREYAIADYISVPSEFVKRTFLDKGFPESKMIKIPYGVSLDSFQQVPKQDSIFRVIFVGSMSLRKGVHYLLQAFAELRLPDAELWLVGIKQPEIETFFRKYQGSFRYFGHVAQARLSQYYSQSSVFAMCSLEEGMAMVQAQAMACGLPLICTTNTGGEDLITDGVEGFVIPIRDVEALKAKLLYCYQHPVEGAQMGQAAKQRIQRGFTWDDYGHQVALSYEQACFKVN